jgi:preflagellin peptidase FlaK
MFCAASYYDLRSREINDLLWIVFGAAGVFLYVFDEFNFSIIPLTGLEFLVAFLCWILRLCGGADVLALTTLSVIFPVYEQIPVTIIVLAIALVIALSYTITNNSCRNLKSLVRNREIFAEIDEPLYKKLAAFFLIHKRNENEGCEFSAEAIIYGKRKFVFRHNPDHEAFGNGIYVITTLPMMPFLLVSLAFFIIISSF